MAIDRARTVLDLLHTAAEESDRAAARIPHTFPRLRARSDRPKVTPAPFHIPGLTRELDGGVLTEIVRWEPAGSGKARRRLHGIFRDRNQRTRFIAVLSVYLSLFTWPSPLVPAANAVTEEQVSILSTFERLDSLELVRVELANRAANAIDMKSPWPGGKKYLGGLTEKQADSVVVIARTFGQQHFDNAVRVAWCESRLNPDAVNEANRNRTTDRGLFMLNDGGTMQRLGVNDREAFDARESTRAAWVLFDDRGWQPWVCARLIGIDHLTKNGPRHNR